MFAVYTFPATSVSRPISKVFRTLEETTVECPVGGAEEGPVDCDGGGSGGDPHFPGQQHLLVNSR